ncbi:anti-sigma factor [Echinicola strongylocentroti]|uniref:Anti-sigma factor n=1 Tax=Echinicola strongylocentroti TaxID=1795355 RepID=A0A2Z4II47_9BACT|nr:FecR family protein [Echinicola strongylocentroti]AWW30188.1 anti-sigma factor [Echinicola strongylocentroti]
MHKNLVNIDFSILWKKVHDSLSEEEEEQFKAWIEENADHQAYFQHLANFYKNGSQFKVEDGIAKKSWPEFTGRLHPSKKRKWRIGSYAASIAAGFALLLVLAAILKPSLYINDSKENKEAIIGPGTEKAILLMDDGTSYDLSSMTSLDLEDGGAQITSQGKSLQYKMDESADVEVKYNTLLVPRGAVFTLSLVDGTQVWLNSGSTLRYPTAFTGQEREVELSGEAYFEVTKNPDSPFRVIADQQIVEVLGTAFNISSYKEEPSVLTTLVEGKVNVFVQDKPLQKQVLTPSEQSMWVKGEKRIEKRTVDVREYIAWKDGWFYFKEKPLGEIMESLARWYDVEVKFENQKTKELPFTGRIRKHEDLKEVLVLLEKTRDVQIEIERRTIIIK